MLQWFYEGDNLTMIDVPAPAPISLVDLIRGTLSEPESGGIYNHFGPTGNDWSVGAFGGTPVPLVFNYQGNAPADVLAAFGSASPFLVSQVTDQNSPLNNQGGSDFSNLLLGASFIFGGALLTGGTGLFSTVFDSISNAVSSVFTAAPEVAWGALDAGPAAIVVDSTAAAAYATAAAVSIEALPTLTIPAVAESYIPWGALDAGSAAIPVDAAAAAAYGASNAATVAATVGGITLATAKDIASLAATAAGIAKAAIGVSAASAKAANPMAAFTSPMVLKNGSDALLNNAISNAAGEPAAAAVPAAAASMYAAFAIAGVALVGIYIFVVRNK